ncbi:MAG: site-specific integrase, partial [Bacteroidota bacterium]
NLKWKDVDLERRLIRVSNSETFTTKTGKTRTVPMNERVYVLLKDRNTHMHEEHVFTFEGKPIRPDFLSRKFRFCIRKSGLPRALHFHSLRHTFATWLVQGSVSIYEVQKLLGHSSLAVTQIYSHLAASELHNAVNKLDSIST